jgi:hypothetical protein
MEYSEIERRTLPVEEEKDIVPTVWYLLFFILFLITEKETGIGIGKRFK